MYMARRYNIWLFALFYMLFEANIMSSGGMCVYLRPARVQT